MRRLLLLALFALAGLGMAACKRTSSSPSGPSAADLSMTPIAPAEAEVSASSGPVKLTLRVHKTHIRQGESLWVQIVIANVGAKPLMVRYEDVDNVEVLLLRAHWGTQLTLTDANGRMPRFADLRSDDLPFGCMNAEERAPWLELVHSTAAQEAFERGSGNDVVWLNPGQTVATEPSAHQSSEDKYCRRLPAPKPITPFAELPEAKGMPVGKYLLSAKYDSLPRGPFPQDPDDVKFELPPVAIEVLP